MPRYEEYGQLDTPAITEGDVGFVGMNSYLEPTSLQPGMVADSQNMVLEGDTATVRKGIDFLAGGVTLTYSAGTEQVFATTIFSDPATGEEFLAAATKDKVILWNDDNASGINIDYPGSEVVATADGASFVQNFEKLILFRGSSKRPLEWDGNHSSPTDFVVKTGTASGSGIACPNTDYGISFRNRLIIPQPTDSNYTVLMSDLLDSNNFTAADSQFRINKGSADFLVGFIPYQEDQLICFFRNSIHLINNVATTSAANVYEITRQHGCVARKSIAQSGPQTYFLSDNGVVVLSPGVDPAKGLGVAISKVQGETIPLTRPIQDQFADVNYAAADKACGVVFDNKYFLAVPTGSSTVPNKIFVFDLLTSQWTSVDDYPAMSGSLAFHVDDWVVCSHGSNPTRRRLFACNDTGWYLCFENSTDDSNRKIGSSSESNTTAISAKLKTRDYLFGEQGIKSFKRGQLGASFVSSDAFTIKLNTTDPDSTTTVLSYTGGSTEEALLRFSGGRKRGYSGNIELDVTAGRPSFRHVQVEAEGQGLNARREVA
tara:strand:+ start:563 stop:2194 length:1632 start_codon:yes stop_codon:yes gene_type:complete